MDTVMSDNASPSGLLNGRTPTPNGGPAQFVRKPKPADPLRPRKKPVRRPNLPPSQVSKDGRPVRRSPERQIAPPKLPPEVPIDRRANGGWTHPPTGHYVDYPLFTTKRALREGLRYHIARFAAKKNIDPTDQEEFTRPILLHRRDPKQPIRGGKEEEEDVPVDSKEREKQEIAKAEAEARKAANQAQIAPTGNNASAIAAKKFNAGRNEKTTQVYRLDKTAEQKRQSDLRYEEALPWHLEDADNQNIWVGNYEAALSDTNVVFAIEGDRFKMIPIEKWYKFSQKNQFKGFSIEEAEARFNKKEKESRWVMKTQEKAEHDRQIGDTRKLLGNLYMVKAESNTVKSAKHELKDGDDLDFDADDLFQDDDEMATVEPDADEDTKESKERIKREQLKANIFDQTNEAEVDKEEKEEEDEADIRKKLGKGVKKALTKREKMTIYDTDSSNPYLSSSEDDTSDEEKQREIDKRKDEEAKSKVKAESKLPSGASSKGTNTPSGRPKYTDPMRKSKNLKRPGSPNLSESSGNESSRKKHKKKHSSQPTGSSTPIPGSRPMPPAPSSSAPTSNQSPRKSSIIKLNVNSSKLNEIQSAPPNPSPVLPSAMSDGEATGGEMSDGGKRKKIKLRIGGPSASNSRAGSPAPGRAGSIGAGGSRAGSPAIQASARSPGAGPIQPHEIVAALPKGGASMGDLVKIFRDRVGTQPGQTNKSDFIKMVKENSAYGTDKLLRPKGA